uniref:Uncharacterized protein n=1 Tax=Rhizophora mucronata TaxID=61149 RepID=A0A2P2PER7_RHIMU
MLFRVNSDQPYSAANPQLSQSPQKFKLDSISDILYDNPVFNPS